MAAKETALTIKRNFTRTAQKLVKKFMNLPTGNVCDAQGRIGALDYRIKPVSEMSQFCGIALTVDSGPRDNLAAWAALKIAKPGDIVLITTGGHLASSVVGDLYVGMAKNAGVAGIVEPAVLAHAEEDETDRLVHLLFELCDAPPGLARVEQAGARVERLHQGVAVGLHAVVVLARGVDAPHHLGVGLVRERVDGGIEHGHEVPVPQEHGQRVQGRIQRDLSGDDLDRVPVEVGARRQLERLRGLPPADDRHDQYGRAQVVGGVHGRDAVHVRVLEEQVTHDGRTGRVRLVGRITVCAVKAWRR